MVKLRKNVKRTLEGFLILGIAIGLGVYAYIVPRGESVKQEETSNEVVEETKQEETTSSDITTNIETTTQQETITQETSTVADHTETTSKGFTLEVKDGLTYVEGILIANKSYPLTSTYVPDDTHKDAHGVTNTCNECIKEVVWNAFQTMKADASTLGLNLYISSGYRSYDTQKKLYERYVARDGQAGADTYSSRPGHSDHQTGYAFDINIIDDSFTNTKEAKWVDAHCYEYGFVIRFPKNGQEYTGYKYESWHLRYVGVELATKLYNDGNWISLEEYFGIPSVYEGDYVS